MHRPVSKVSPYKGEPKRGKRLESGKPLNDGYRVLDRRDATDGFSHERRTLTPPRYTDSFHDGDDA